jgi:BlaR1 peptidase M56
LATGPFLVHRFVEPHIAPRVSVWVYLALLMTVLFAVLGLLTVLAVFLLPYWLMGDLGIGCLHQGFCPHGLPIWAQFGLWLPGVGLLGALLWRMAWTATSIVFAGRRARRIALTHGICRTPCPVYEIEDSAVVACTVGIVRPLILLSSGLREALSPAEYGVVVEHERAHAAAHDNLAILIARVVERTLFFLPGMREASRGARRSIEVAADASAAKCTGDPLLVAASVTTVANLLFESAKVGRPRPQPAMAFFTEEELVVQRVRRLVFGDPIACSWRRLICVVAALVLALSVFSTSIYLVTGNNIGSNSQTTTCTEASS